MLYDLIVIGGGPAGCASAVYAARKKLKTLIITESFGGQSIVSNDIENWIGEKHISGVDLAKKLEEHVRAYEEDAIDIKTGEKVTKIKKIECSEPKKRPCDFSIITDKKESHKAKAVIVTSGARRRKLNVPGEQDYEGKGVAYCATCDAPLFKDKVVAVVGGGNAGLEAVVDLDAYASKIYLLEYGDKLKGDPVTQEEIKNNDKVKIILNAQTLGIEGDKLVNGLRYKDRQNDEEKELKVGGVFVEIGSIPNSEIVAELVELDDHKQIKIDSKHASTSHQGIFAAGDVTEDPYKQNNISAGDGVKAALAAYAYLLQKKKSSPAEEQ